MPFSHQSEHTKLLTSLIINLWMAVFYEQLLPWEGLNKPQGDPDSSSSSHFSLCPLRPVSSASFVCKAFLLNFLCGTQATPIALDSLFLSVCSVSSMARPPYSTPVPSLAGFICLILLQSLLLNGKGTFGNYCSSTASRTASS